MKSIFGNIFLLLLGGMLVSSAASCNKRPKDVLSDKEMTQLMADMQMAEAYLKNGNPGNLPDSTRRMLTESVLAERGLTYAQLDSTLAWYGKHLDLYYNLYDRVDRELAKRQRKSGSATDNIDFSGDNLWQLADNMAFSSKGTMDGLTFSIKTPDLQKGESLEWAMRLNATTDVRMILGVDYEDGTTSFTSGNNYGSRQLKTELLTDTGRNVTRIYGTLSIPPDKLPLWADSIRLLKHPFDSLTYHKLRNQRFYSYD